MVASYVLPQSIVRHFEGSNEGKPPSPDVTIGRDSPDPNWAMPDFLKEAFHRRAAELIGEVEEKPSEPIKGSEAFSISEGFAKPDGWKPDSGSRRGIGFGAEGDVPKECWGGRAGQEGLGVPEHDPLWKARNWIGVQELFGYEPAEDDFLRVRFWQSRQSVEGYSADDLFMSPDEIEREFSRWKEEQSASENVRAVPTRGQVCREGIVAIVKMSTISPIMNAVAKIGRLVGHPFPKLEERVFRHGQQLKEWTKQLASGLDRLIEEGRLLWGDGNERESESTTELEETRDLSRTGQGE